MGLEAVAESERDCEARLVFMDVQMPMAWTVWNCKGDRLNWPLPMHIVVTGFHDIAMADFDRNRYSLLLKAYHSQSGDVREMIERGMAVLLHFDEDPVPQAVQRSASIHRERTANFAKSWPRKRIRSYCSTRPDIPLIFTWTTYRRAPPP